MEAVFATIPMPVIIFAVLAVLAIGVMLVITYLRDRTFEEIRRDIYGLMKKAEKKYKESSQGQQKMKWVIGKARLLLPPWLQQLLSDAALEAILQVYFDEIKDLLDNGKLDGSAGSELDE